MAIEIKFKRLSYSIKGFELFGIILTTRKQLEQTPLNLDIETKEVDEK